MSQMEQDLQQVEISLQEAKSQVELAAALQRLHDNADFKKVILSGYFEKEAQRSVMLKYDINYVGEENQTMIDNVIAGIGMLGQYFHKIFVLGEQAHQALVADEQTREEILQEQLTAESENLVN